MEENKNDNKEIKDENIIIEKDKEEKNEDNNEIQINEIKEITMENKEEEIY